MNGTLQIAVDLEEGTVQLGAERVRLLPGRGDAFYLNNRRGPMVRALRFEERSVLLSTNTANDDVASLIANAAFVSSGECGDLVRVAVSLALAGGGEEAPSFSECARLVEQHAGWNPERVSGTLALVVDRLCSNVESNGWERIVFEEDESDLETLIARMVANLSERAVATAPIVKKEAQEITTAKQRNSPGHDSPLQKHIQKWPGVQFERESNEPLQRTTTRSVSSASSVSPVNPVKRIPARVLAPTPSRNTDHENSIIRVSHNSESTIEVPAAPARMNQTNAVLTQTAPTVFEQPLFTSPSSTTWQAGKPSAARPTAQHTLEKSEPRFSANTESPSVNDYLSELALLLEAECDLRGIDP